MAREVLRLKGLAEAPLLGMTWLVYASSSPVDTISRMATGRWSVRPDSWVIKLNSSTSCWGEASLLDPEGILQRKGLEGRNGAAGGGGWSWPGSSWRQRGGSITWASGSLGQTNLVFRGQHRAEGCRARVPYLQAWPGHPARPRLTAFQSGHSPSSAYST